VRDGVVGSVSPCETHAVQCLRLCVRIR
jgi:hypothetical protein